jgi:hypothetical protein
MTSASRAKTVPKNYPSAPAAYPLGLFRPQIEAAKRYLFESELKEVLELSNMPPGLMDSDSYDFALTVAHVACFVQNLKTVAGDDKGVGYGRDAFKQTAPLFARGTATLPVLRAVSAVDKLFLRIRDAMSIYNRHFAANVLVKWHGGAQSDLFEDTAQHCYGFVADEPICQTMTGFLQEAIGSLSGVKVTLEEVECMARGALACRWHCSLA